MARRLIDIERSIVTYDNSTKKILKEVNIDDVISFESLKSIVPPPVDDPLLYEGYELSIQQLGAINSYLNEKIDFDLVLYFYVLECTGIYED